MKRRLDLARGLDPPSAAKFYPPPPPEKNVSTHMFLTLNISTIGETLIFRSGWVMGIMHCVYFFPPLALLINHYKLDWKFQDFPLFPLIFPVFEKIVTKE